MFCEAQCFIFLPEKSQSKFLNFKSGLMFAFKSDFGRSLLQSTGVYAKCLKKPTYVLSIDLHSSEDGWKNTCTNTDAR